MKYDAANRWSTLDGQRRGFITRCEQYAAYTLPKLCLPSGYSQNNQELQHEWQSLGAQATNHLSNKLMLALFAPSRPFFRLAPDSKLLEEMSKIDVSESQLSEILSTAERKAIQTLDGMKVRPKLYDAIKHLIVLGNCLMILRPDGIRILGIKKYCCKRDVEGRVMEILIKEEVLFDELASDVQEVMKLKGYKNNSQQKVCLYKWIKRQPNNDYVMTQSVDGHQLPQEFSGKWPEDQLPYRVLTWDLADESDYGTGLVEDYSGDFAAMSAMSEAQVTAAILASEFRWLLNPGSTLRPEDIQKSASGDVLPGNEGDLALITSQKGNDLALIQAVNSEYVQRIGRGFLLGSAVTRDAERVTAEEIRMQANELESSLGGAYSRLAVDFQEPLAYWLLPKSGIDLKGSNIKPVIVTGLDALSRNGDLENLKMFLGDMAAVATLPEPLQAILRMREIASDMAAGRGLASSKYILSEEEIARNQKAQAEAQAAQTAVEAGAQAGAQVAAKQAGA